MVRLYRLLFVENPPEARFHERGHGRPSSSSFFAQTPHNRVVNVQSGLHMGNHINGQCGRSTRMPTYAASSGLLYNSTGRKRGDRVA